MTAKQNTTGNIAPDGSMYVTICDGGGNLGSGNSSLAAGTAAIGSVNLVPLTTQGPGTYAHAVSAATTNATSVKASAGILTGGSIRNNAAAVKWVKFYNKASAPTVGTDIPVLTIGLPAASVLGIASITGSSGARFSTGIAYAITGAFADADATAVASGDIEVNLIYT